MVVYPDWGGFWNNLGIEARVAPYPLKTLALPATDVPILSLHFIFFLSPYHNDKQRTNKALRDAQSVASMGGNDYLSPSD